MLKYKSLHSKIEEQETNAIYYLLRKFGLLQETISLSQVSSVTGKYGVYNYDADNNTLVISNAEPTTIYKIVFTILDADNNARTVSVTGKETNGSVNITVPTIATEELLLEKIKVIITYAQEIVQDYIVNEPSEIIGTGGEYITIADLSNKDLPDRFILSFDYKSNYESRVGLFSKENFTGNPNYSVFVGMPPDTLYHYYGFRTTSTQTTDITGRIREYSHFTIERDGDTFKYTRNGAVLGSKTINWFDNYDYIVGMMQWGTDGEHSVKNVQMVALPDRIDLGLTGDKDIIQSSETATVIATLTKNGVAVTGETLNYEILHNGSVISSGSAVTDGNGEATISYTGTGVGQIKVVISYGIFLQETFVLWDTLYHDEATTGNKNSNYIISTSGVSVGDATDNGTPITYTTNSKVYTPSSNSAQLQFSAPICVEFDVVEVSNVRLRFHQSDSLYSDVHLSTGHYKIRIVENKKYVSKNGGTETESNFNYTSTFKMWMQSSSSTANITFKNLKVYSA